MMGRQQRVQKKLFYTKFSLDQRVPNNHILRKVAKYIDFDFIYKEVKDKYGSNGNVSVPPPVILKMMLLLVFYNVRSERELMSTIPVRLDWLWFLGYDLDDEVPNHSVLSKARTRWGVAAFQSLFDGIVIQCVNTGLVDGSKLFMDSSNIQADASNNSVVNKEYIKRYLKKSYRLFEQRLETEKANINNNDIRTCQHLMERSFARSCRYGFKRARWRRTWRVQIQEYLTAAIQNIMVLLRHVKEPSAAMSMVAARVNKKRASSNLLKPHFYFKKALTITIKNHLSLQYCFL